MPDERREMVDHPAHYGGDVPYEVIKVLKAWLPPEAFRGWLLGTIIKYLPRARAKGAELEDLRKARWYLDYLIREVEVRDAEVSKLVGQAQDLVDAAAAVFGRTIPHHWDGARCSVCGLSDVPRLLWTACPGSVPDRHDT